MSAMDWVPIVFVVFKVGVLGTGMFYAIKWHHDQDQKKKQADAEKARQTQSAAEAGE